MRRRAEPTVCVRCGDPAGSGAPITRYGLDEEPRHLRCWGLELLDRALELAATVPSPAHVEHCEALVEKLAADHSLTPAEVAAARAHAPTRERSTA